MKNAPLLILDDLDTQTGIAWVRDRLFQLLNYRHTARLPTVITTALSLDDLGERLASRLVDHAVCTSSCSASPSERKRRRGAASAACAQVADVRSCATRLASTLPDKDDLREAR